MAIKKLNSSTKTKKLIRMTSESSKYYLYEVEDIVSHFIAHIQNELATNGLVKIDGLGTIKATKMKSTLNPAFRGNHATIAHDAIKLSIKVDEAMRQNLKENYNVAFPNSEQ
jgi:nucleoid DNA-binding protein